MTHHLSVEALDGTVAWEGDADEASIKGFPEEWRGRPVDGDPPWRLLIDGEVIGVQVSIADEEADS